MSKHTIRLRSLDGIEKAAEEFVSHMNGKVLAFYGDMGAGKTTFIKAVCRQLGVEEVITSPTFSIVNEYTTGRGESVFHFDFYRIKKIEEVFDMGYEDYFYSGRFCFIEWPELVEQLLPSDAVKVVFQENADGSRTIEW